MGHEQFIGFNPWTALVIFCNLIITFLILKKFLFKPVNKMIDDRQQEIDDLYADADKSKADAQALRAEYEGKLASAREESQALLRDAAATAQKRSDELIREAKDEAAAIKRKAQGDIDLEKKKALNDAKDEISDLAMDIAEKVVGKELDRQDQQALIEEFLQNVGDQS